MEKGNFPLPDSLLEAISGGTGTDSSKFDPYELFAITDAEAAKEYILKTGVQPVGTWLEIWQHYQNGDLKL